MNEPIKATEARKQWKELLDRAANGEVIKIERGGVIFVLGTYKSISAGHERVTNAAVNFGVEMGKHISKRKTKRSDSGKVDCYCPEFAVTPHSHIQTDDISSDLRPVIPVIEAKDKTPDTVIFASTPEGSNPFADLHKEAESILPPSKNLSLDPSDQKPMSADEVMGDL